MGLKLLHLIGKPISRASDHQIPRSTHFLTGTTNCTCLSLIGPQQTIGNCYHTTIMKILEAQSATLTNYEVYTHLTEQRSRYAKKGIKGRRPGNLETVVKELLEYFHEAPSPLASKPLPYNDQTIGTLLERLRPLNFTKAEILASTELQLHDCSSAVIINMIRN